MITTDLETELAPALLKYRIALAEHGHDYANWSTPQCRCGWVPSSRGNLRRAVGIHVAAAHRRASKMYDADAAVVLSARTALI